jgi:hypothetical protein
MSSQMMKAEAARALREILRTATEEQHRDVVACLELGGGCMPLPEDATMAEPADVPADRRWTWVQLAEGVRYSGGPEAWEAPFVSALSGGWESVLASLVLTGAWGTVAEAAAELRRDYPDGRWGRR